MAVTNQPNIGAHRANPPAGAAPPRPGTPAPPTPGTPAPARPGAPVPAVPPRPVAAAPATPASPDPTKKGIYLTGVVGSALDELCFLTFHKPTSLYDPASTCFDTYAGVRLDPATKKWTKIDSAWVAPQKRQLSHELIWEFPDNGPVHVAYLDTFADRVWKHFSTFTHEKAKEFAKATLKGDKKEGCPAFVLKALQLGFEGIGLVAEKPNLLQRLAGTGAAWTANAVKPYVEDLLRDGAAKLDGCVHEGFEAVSVSTVAYPWPAQAKDTAFKYHGQAKGYRSGQDEYWATHPIAVDGKFAPHPVANDLAAINAFQKSKFRDPKGFVYVNEYAFRGDARLPILVKAAGGFHPNATRDDKQAAVAARATPVLDSMAHQKENDDGSNTSGFVSLSRARQMPLEFIGTRLAGEGFLYAVRCIGGVDVNATWEKPVNVYEHEISAPGSVGWEDVVAFRRVHMGAMTGPVYVTKDAKALPADKKKSILHVYSIQHP